MTNTKKVLAAAALMFVGYIIGQGAPTAPSATLPISSISSTDASSVDLDRVTQTPAHEPWGMNYTVEHNTAGGEGGWVMTEVGVTHGHECLIMVSLEPYRAIVVNDSSVMCEEAAVSGDADTPGVESGDTRSRAGDARQQQGDARAEDGRPVPQGYYNEAPAPAPAKPSKSSAAPTTPAAPAPSSGLVNLNTASQSELEALPGVGEKTAQKIIAARPLASVEAVDSVPGVGPAMFGQIKDLVTV